MFFPVIGEETELPYYVCGVGIDTYEYFIDRPHGFFYPQFLIFTEGEGELNVCGRTYCITKSMTAFLPADVPHEYHKTTDIWRSWWISFNGYNVNPLLEKLGFTEPCVFATAEPERILRILKRIHSSLSYDKLYGNYYASSELYNFIIELYRMTKKLSDTAGHSDKGLENAVRYMEEHYSEKISLDDLCGVSELSRGYLCRMFKKYFNMRPMEYLNKKRIQKSKEYLNFSYISVEKLAKDVGFETPSYFTKLFRQYEGMTPSEYRERVHR